MPNQRSPVFSSELLLLIQVYYLLIGLDCHYRVMFDVLDNTTDILTTKIGITPKELLLNGTISKQVYMSLSY